MSEIIRCCDNCKHYDQLFCNYKKMYKLENGMCENWKEKTSQTAEMFVEIEKKTTKDDQVSHPSHYTDGNIEVIDYIEDKNFNFNLGNVVKYVSRAGKKDKDKIIQDLKKANWYLNREISNLEKNV